MALPQYTYQIFAIDAKRQQRPLAEAHFGLMREAVRTTVYRHPVPPALETYMFNAGEERALLRTMREQRLASYRAQEPNAIHIFEDQMTPLENNVEQLVRADRKRRDAHESLQRLEKWHACRLMLGVAESADDEMEESFCMIERGARVRRVGRHTVRAIVEHNKALLRLIEAAKRDDYYVRRVACLSAPDWRVCRDTYLQHALPLPEEPLPSAVPSPLFVRPVADLDHARASITAAWTDDVQTRGLEGTSPSALRCAIEVECAIEHFVQRMGWSLWIVRRLHVDEKSDGFDVLNTATKHVKK